MATRGKSSLAKGTVLTDYATPSRIRKAFNESESAIRKEYSRQRSIIRKRVERLAEAGETYNKFYQRFGNLQEALPTSKNLSTEQMLRIMSSSAAALSGAYQTTLTQIKEARKETFESLKAQAEFYGDTKLSKLLEREPTAKQYERIRKLYGMLKHAGAHRIKGSGDTYQEATEAVLSNDGKTSLLTLADQVMDKIGIQFEERVDMFGQMKEKYTAKGTERVSYAKAQGKRGS